MALFEKGNQEGKKRGPNKLTRTVKERVMTTFDELQDDDKANLTAWAKREPTEFYKIAAKLIPTEIRGELEVSGDAIAQLVISPAPAKPDENDNSPS